MKKIKDIEKYFRFDKEKQKIYFIGDSLQVYVPKYYEDREFLEIGQKVKTLGIFKMIIDSKYEAVFMMVSILTLDPERPLGKFVDEKKEEYYVLNFHKDSVFIDNTLLVKNPNILYKIFMTFIALGKIPSFIDYNDISMIFDNDLLLCGTKLKANHAVYEMIFAHMYRDSNDPFKFYRLTDMENEPIIIPMHSIAFGPQSTTAKIIGSYFTDAITSAMVAPHQEDAVYDLENLLRA